MNTEQKLIESIGIPLSIKQMQVKGYKINYCVAGQGSPLLLLHGANFGWGVWYPNIAELAEHFTVYALDLPGAGRSSRVDYAKLDPEKDLRQVVEDFVRQLDLKDLNVIGCSIGGWLAFQLALREPERVHKIIVENAVGFADYMGISDKMIGFYPLAKLISRLFINPKDRNAVEKFLRGIFYHKDLALSREFLDYFHETMQTSHNLLFISRLTALHKQFNLEAVLPAIKHETMIIWGEEDKVIPLKKNRKNFNLLPKVDVRLIKEAGHIPSLEKPKEFNVLVKQFLMKIDK